MAVTPLALQKLLYFLHGRYLLRTGAPLVAGFFEAWKRGPVHPQQYHCFKIYGSRHIDGRAERIDPVSGEVSIPAPPDDGEARESVQHILLVFRSFTPGQLVRISHAHRGPWHRVFADYQARAGRGVRISNELIREAYQYHKVSADNLLIVEEPDEDTPLE
jgi:uncharacterized phage-associated protein